MTFKPAWSCILLVLTISAGVLYGCNNDNPVSKDIVTPQVQNETTDIGYLVGSPVHLRNSSLLAVETINQAGGILGRDFNVVVLQSESPAVSAEKAINLMDNFQIPLLVVTTSSRTLAVVEEAVPREVVVLSETGTSPTLTIFEDNDYLFRTAPSDVYQGRMLANLAWEKGAMSAAMLVNSDDVYGTGLAHEFELEFTRLGGALLNVVEVPQDVTLDFGEYIPQVYQGNPDAVILSLLDGAVDAQFVNESINEPFNGFYLLPDTAVGDPFTNNLVSADVVDRAWGVSPSFGVENHLEFMDFRDRYQRTFGTVPQQFSANVYDATIIAALAMEHAGMNNNTDAPTGKMIRQSMRAVMNPPGKLLGPSQLSEALSRIRSGQAVDYVGAYSTVDFDGNGDLVGTLVYDIHQYDNQTGKLSVYRQWMIEVPLERGVHGPAAIFD
jgi:ABC-type branched-subunit amino acid transport system substrate-binding protein